MSNEKIHTNESFQAVSISSLPLPAATARKCPLNSPQSQNLVSPSARQGKPIDIKEERMAKDVEKQLRQSKFKSLVEENA